MRRVIYLASPYSHKNERIQDARFCAAKEATWLLMKNGLMVYSPIVHGHTVAHLQTNCEPLVWTHQQWLDLDLEIVKRFDEVWVLCLPGWEKSKGVQMELDFAKELGKPIVFLDAKSYCHPSTMSAAEV